MPTALDPAAVVAASNAWIWTPDDAERIDTDDYLLVRFPDYLAVPTQVLRTSSDRAPGALIAEVAEHARRWSLTSVSWWVKLDCRPAGMEPALQRAGAYLDVTLDVLARDLSDGGLASDRAAGVEIRVVRDEPTERDAEVVAVEVFGGRVPPAERLGAEAARWLRNEQAGTEAKLVGYLDGSPVGIGGLALVDGVARLWGGGTVTAARHRGVYRALLAARLRWAIRHGATLALVKGRIQTSGPILQRAGFEPFGQERSYELTV